MPRSRSSVRATLVSATAGMRPPRSALERLHLPHQRVEVVIGRHAVADEHVGAPGLERVQRVGDRADRLHRRAAMLEHGPQQVAPFGFLVEHQDAKAVEERRRCRAAQAAADRRAARSRRGCSGKRAMKIAPPPSSRLRASISPPCSSTSSRTSARPTPSPPALRVGDESAWVKRSKMRGRNSGRCRGRCRGRSAGHRGRRRPTAISTVPPRGVNLIALASSCQAIWRSRVGSPWTATPASVSVDVDSHAFGLRRRRRRRTACRTASSSSDGRSLSWSLPVSAFETSSRSAGELRLQPDVAIDRFEARGGRRRSSLPVRSRWTQPSTALSGVRSSCEMVRGTHPSAGWRPRRPPWPPAPRVPAPRRRGGPGAARRPPPSAAVRGRETARGASAPRRDRSRRACGRRRPPRERSRPAPGRCRRRAPSPSPQ